MSDDQSVIIKDINKLKEENDRLREESAIQTNKLIEELKAKVEDLESANHILKQIIKYMNKESK